MTPAPQHRGAAQPRAVEAAQVRDQLDRLMAVRHARYAPSQRPIVPPAVRPDPAGFEAQEWARRRREAAWWQRSRRRAIRAEVTVSAQQQADLLYVAAAQRVEEEQRRADRWWAALVAGDPAVARAALETAVVENTAPVRVVQAAGASATVAILLPESSVLPARRPSVTPTGKPTTKAWTQTEFNDAYADLLGAHLLAMLRQTWAVTPSVVQARVVGLLDTAAGLQVLFDVATSRTGGAWSDDTAGRRLLDSAVRGLHRTGRTRAVQPWPIDQLSADTAAWIGQAWALPEHGRSSSPAASRTVEAQPDTGNAARPSWTQATPPAPAPAVPTAFASATGQPGHNRTRWGQAVAFLAAHPTKRAGLNWATWATAALVALLAVIGAATGSPNSSPVADRATSTPPGLAATSPTATTPAATAAASSTTTTRAVPSSASAHPADSTGGVRIPAAGIVLPNPARTPGATNPAVTQATITSTICVTGWTATIRPSSSYTAALKQQQLTHGYAYHGDLNPGDYEEDHLIPLELGGSPSAETNLWPEPEHATDGAYSKDKIENKLHALVCAGSLSLRVAQHAIASNWFTAYQHYVSTNTPAPRPSSTYHPVPTTTHPAPPPSPQTSSPGAPLGATAICNDGTYSYAQHHQGACSHHGGVRVWL